MINIAAALDQAIRVVCPIVGVSIGDASDKRTWRLDFATEASVEQQAAAKAVLEAFDPAKLPWRVSKKAIRERLYVAGKLKAANDALYAATDDDAVMRAQLWDDADSIMSDDQRARAFLVAIGADPDKVLAP